MTILLVLLALWLYAGRAVLLGLLFINGALQEKSWNLALTTSTGLLITPILLSIASIWSAAYILSLLLLVCVDIFLLYLLIRRRSQSKRDSYLFLSGLLIFTLIVFSLSWLNGPYVEHLSDAWWHMKNVSWLERGQTLIIPNGQFGSNPLKGVSSFFGLDYSSYRLQALFSWLAKCSTFDSWFASSVAVSSLLAISVFLLAYYLRLDWTALCLSLLFWLLLLGGMNTGLRLSAWPAGMGYVFLNLGLIACFQLYCDSKSGKAWRLLAICTLGTLFFHIAELFLLTVAVSSSIVLRLLFVKSS
ncbi:MAG: hypothetical protein ACR2QW_04610, partial [bacterium]